MVNFNVGRESRVQTAAAAIRDLQTGEWIEICSPEMFDLETVLLDSAIYTSQGREYRFLLCHARRIGLKAP